MKNFASSLSLRANFVFDRVLNSEEIFLLQSKIQVARCIFKTPNFAFGCDFRWILSD